MFTLYYVTLHCDAHEDPGKMYVELHYITLRRKRNQESFCNELHFTTMQANPEQLHDELHYKVSGLIKDHNTGTLHYFRKPA